MYKDIISYTLAEWVTVEQLAAVAKKVLDDWMSKQEGFLGREINQDTDRQFVDIVSRASKDAADKANETMTDIPHAEQRYACYDMATISSSWVTQMFDSKDPK